MTKTVSIIAVALLLTALTVAHATVAVSSLFGTNMVLQRDRSVPVWGTAAASKTITVTYNGQTKTTTSDAQGNWLLYLDAMAVKTSGSNMTISEAGANTLTFTNVVVGDVWIASGQSNMAFGLSGCNRQTDIDAANYPNIRHIWAPMVTSRDPLRTISSSWQVCSPSTAGGFSAVAFYFGRKIYQDQSSNIPIGLITTSIGGTVIDIWLAPEGLSDIPVIQPLYNMEIMPWGPFCAFDGMVYPFAPSGAKGMIWYQGENRESTNQSTDSYYLKEKALQQGWKRAFGLDDFALYVVQLANYTSPPTNSTPEGLGSWPDTRQMQEMVTRLPHGGMASAIDVGEAGDIHPKDKLDVGERLALWALKNDYGRTTVVPSGPILRDVTISGSTLVCSFDYVGAGLMVGLKTPYQPTQEVVDGTLQMFVIAGSNGVWYAANATISGSTVVVSSPSVTTPRKVAYAYWINPSGANLYNRDGLPASPFYVDDVTAKYTVTASAPTNGSISPSGVTTYLKRATALYTITPDSGYYIQDVQVDGVSVGSVKAYTFDPLYANHTISATFVATAPSYTITASGNASGSPSPSGTINVNQGGSQTLNMAPNANCRLISVTADGAPLGNRNSVTFTDVRTSHTVSAFFAPIPTPGTGTGLRGDYHAGANFDTFRVSRTDATVNFDWAYGSPDAAIPIDGFSVRWTGQIHPQFTETYKFYLTHDDGARLWVNNTLVVDAWGSSGSTDSGSIALTAGVKVPIKIEYFENINTANCKLEWYSTSLPREVVPQTQLYPATTPIYTLTASSGAGGSLSPTGTVLANSGASQTFSVIPSTGYYITDVKVDSVSQGPVTSYSFTNIIANHTISATFTALPSYTVSGRVTKQSDGTGISGATVGFYTAPSVIGSPSYSATTNTSGNYSVSIPTGTWYVRALATGYFTSAPQTVTVLNAAVTNINFVLMASTRNIPRTSDLLFSAVTDTFPASGNTGNWASYLPSGQTWTSLGTPTVQTIDGVKWEQNIYNDTDGYRQATYSSAIPTSGVTIATIVKPQYMSVGGEARGEVVDFFYSDLFMAVAHNTGEVIVDWRGYGQAMTGYKIPDGQKTVLSLVVQPGGQMSLYANGVLKWGPYSTGADYTSLQQSGLGGAAKTICIGRNDYDGWSTYNGYIGDVFVYKVALSDTERLQLETDLTSKFMTGGATTWPITATAGAGGSISPNGTTMVSPGANQPYTITPNTGYAVSNVTVDGVSKGAITSFTFTNVTAGHGISASFSQLTYTITATAGANGSISPSGTTTKNYGDSQTYTITPNTGYAIASVLVDGANQGAIGSYTFNSVTANHTISATFSVITYTITASAGANGSISPSGAVSVNYGASKAFTITPNGGYGISDLKIDGASVTPTVGYTFSSVTANHTISATFGKPVGMNNKAALTDVRAPGRVVKLWGKVKSFNGATSFVITGYTYKDPITHAAVTVDMNVSVNGAALPSGFGVDKFVTVVGIIGADRTMQAQLISVVT